VAKFFLKGAGIGALLVGIPFAFLAAITYDPKLDLPIYADIGESTFWAAVRGFGYGAFVGAAVGGPIGAVIRAFFKTEDN
jgi:hypothetical protein